MVDCVLCVVYPVVLSRNIMIIINFAILDLDEWKTEIRTNGGAVQDYTISYQNLKPSTTYYFRVIAYNEHGISEPCTNDETVRLALCQPVPEGNSIFCAKLLYNFKKS